MNMNISNNRSDILQPGAVFCWRECGRETLKTADVPPVVDAFIRILSRERMVISDGVRDTDSVAFPIEMVNMKA